MRSKIFIHLLSTGLLAIFGTGLLTGCAEKNVDYNIDGVTESSEVNESAGKSGVAQFENETTWNEIWTVSGEGDKNVEVEVDADILLPKTEQMSVVEVKVTEIDVEKKERIAKQLFQGEGIYYYDEATDKVGALAEEYIGDEYIGMHDGIMYELYFEKNDTSEGWPFNFQRINFRAYQFLDICPKGLEDATYYGGLPYGDAPENKCSLSEEEAQKLAREMVEKLGWEYPVLTYARPLIWGNDSLSANNYEEWPANGYVFTYDFGVDDVSFTNFGSDWEYANMSFTKKDEELQYSTAARIEVYVTDQGVIQMIVDSPVEATGITERVELLPLNTIKELMKEYLEKRYEEFRFTPMGVDGELIFTHMELIYFRVRDKKNPGHYSYVPAWRLSEQIGAAELGNREIRNPVIVNAIDGSLIDICEEL